MGGSMADVCSTPGAHGGNKRSNNTQEKPKEKAVVPRVYSHVMLRRSTSVTWQWAPVSERGRQGSRSAAKSGHLVLSCREVDHYDLVKAVLAPRVRQHKVDLIEHSCVRAGSEQKK
jgi:hypothetical protein